MGSTITPQPQNVGRSREPLRRLGHGVVELLSHTVMAGLILGAIKALEKWANYLWGKEKLLFGRIPVSFLFDGADLMLLVGFLTIGIFFILRAYFKKNG